MEAAIVGIGVVAAGVSDLPAFWEAVVRGAPTFSEPRQRYALERFWSPDIDAEDRTTARRSGFIHSFRPHRVAGIDVSAGTVTPHAGSVPWLRHCLAQARSQVATSLDDRHGCYIGAGPAGCQRTDEATLVEVVAHNLAERLGNGDRAAGASRLRAELSACYATASDQAGPFLPEQMVRAAIRDLLPDDTDVIAVDTACSSSLYAVDLAIKGLATGELDIAYAGGVFCLGPHFSVAFSKLGGLAGDGMVRTFHPETGGTMFGDGAGVVVLKDVDRAWIDGDRIWGVVAGFGGSSDGSGTALHAPNPEGQRRCIQRAHDAAGLSAADVDWVVAHGTGTRRGDSTELAALSAVMDDGVLCTGNKAVLGHTAWSAGVLSLIHALLAMRHKRVPAHVGLYGHDFAAPGKVRIPTSPVPWPVRQGPRIAGVSAFGMGGTNAHLLVADRPVHSKQRMPDRAQADDVVLVGWNAYFPGEPSTHEIADVLAGGAPSWPRRFVDPFEHIRFDQTKVPPRVARALDPSQVLALRVTARFAAEHGPLWDKVRESTAVVGAHAGPLVLAMDNLVRCYARDLQTVFHGRDAELLAEYLAQVRRRTQATNKHTLVGVLANSMVSRVANRYDLHGPALHVDAGPDSGLTAVRVAHSYLSTRGADLALVLGVNANSRPELVHMVDTGGRDIAEGAVLLALAREPVAREQGWPVLADLRLGFSLRENEIRSAIAEPADGRTLLGVDGIVNLLRALHRSPVATLATVGQGRLFSVTGARRSAWPEGARRE